MRKVIYLNAGHSEVDPGANVPNGIYENESQLNKVIRDFLIPELKEQGFEVILIPDDKNLAESYLWVNSRTFNIDDGLALAIHNNCCGGEGAETYYYGYSESSRKIAQKLLDGYCAETGLKNRGAKSDSTARFGELSWIRETKVWATLIECGYIDNNNDMDFILNNIDKVAKGIAKGVCRIYNIPYKENQPSQLSRIEIIQEIKKLLDKLK